MGLERFEGSLADWQAPLQMREGRIEEHRIMIRQGRISVVHVAAQFEMGGMEKLLVEFARHTDREAFDLHFVSLSTRGKLSDDIEACGWKVIALHQPPG